MVRTRIVNGLIAFVLALGVLTIPSTTANAATVQVASTTVQASNAVSLAKKGQFLYRCRKWNWFWGWMEVVTADRVSAEKNGYVCYQCIYRP